MSAPGDDLRAHLRQAISALQELRRERDELLRKKSEPIAIIGIGCRLPGGARDPASFWQALLRGVDGVCEIPAARWPTHGAPVHAGGARWAALLDQIDQFDAAFFGISPRESSSLDPQQRLLLEVTWEALERAGQPSERLVGSQTGVFMGIIHPDYRDLLKWNGTDSARLDVYGATGCALSSAAGRISYLLGLNGPCVAVDTACSSSLVAVHLACQSLRSGESTLALAGGVNLIASPLTMQMVVSTQTLSPDGRCRTFDARANGTVRGEGCGVIVLKRLTDAQRDRDPILALIRGSAVNHDGRSTGFTAPSVLAQQALLRQALASAQVAAEQIGYVEAHGTATPLGDPIELEALKEVLGQPRADRSACFLSSVKTNLGHLEAAAGIAGLIKTVLVLQNQRIPPHLNFKTLNPRISLAGTPFVIPVAEHPWPFDRGPRLGGVSSFGLSGTNAHVILEAAAATLRPPLDPSHGQVLLLTAKTEPALRARAEQYRAFLTAPAGPAELVDISYTASVRRSHYPHRLAVFGATLEEWAAALSAFGQGEIRPGSAHGYARAGQRPKLAFLFSGQGSHWLGMGQELLVQEAVFRQVILDCDAAIKSEAGWSLLAALRAEPQPPDLNNIALVQPMVFAMAVALSKLLNSWGIHADAVIGHSMGELAAAFSCGALSLKSAVRVICTRSALLQKLSGLGAMAHVSAATAEVQQLLVGHGERLTIAGSNGPRSTVVSGESAAVEEFVGQLKEKGVLVQLVRVGAASHSRQIELVRDELLAALADIRSLSPHTPMYSTVSGQPVQEGMLDATYWYRNLREPVRFWPVVEQLRERGYELFVELSPHPILVPAVQQGLLESGAGVALGTLRREQPERRCLQETLAAVFVRGSEVSWSELHPAKAQCVELPTYPWQREPYWLPDSAPDLPEKVVRTAAPAGEDEHPLLGRPFAVATQPEARFWECRVGLAGQPYLSDHRIHGEVVFPGCGYIELALAAARRVRPDPVLCLEGIVFERMLVLSESTDSVVQTTLTKAGEGRAELRIFRQEDGPWVRHAAAAIHWAKALPAPEATESLAELAAIRLRCRSHSTKAEHYQRMQQLGFDYGPSFQGVHELWLGEQEALAKVKAPECIESQLAAYHVHPGWLDACVQSAMSSITRQEAEIFVPEGIEHLAVYQRPPFGYHDSVWVHSTVAPGELSIAADLRVFAEDGQLLLRIRGIKVKRVVALSSERPGRADSWLYEAQWRQQGLLHEDARPELHGQLWLIFIDQKGCGAKVRSVLQQRGARCVEIRAGEQYQRLAADHFQVDPCDAQGYSTLLHEVCGKSGCTGIVHLFSLDGAESAQLSAAQLMHEQQLGCHGVLSLVQSVLRSRWRQAPRLFLVLRGSQGVTAADHAPDVAQAPLWGLGQAIAREHPELLCTRVDLSASATADEVEELLAELAAGTLEQQVALRGRERFVARLVRATVPDRAPSEAVRLHEDGTYLISGGLSGLGLATAEGLAAHGARHLVLVGRRAPDDAATTVLAQLRAQGVSVLTKQVDVADSQQVAALMTELSGTWPPLRGVIHSAAVLDDGVLVEQSWERFARVMAPKMYGLWNLHLATRDEPLDFFVGYSSAASLVGVAGQASYVAANAFVDAVAHHRRRLGRCGLSINWGAVADRGMSARLPEVAKQLAQRGVSSLPLAAVNRILFRLLADPRPQLGVIDLDVRRWLASFPELVDSPFWSELQTAAAQRPSGRTQPEPDSPHKLLSASREEQPTLLSQFLIEQLSQVLRLSVSRIDVQAPLMQLGFDSLMAVELRNRLYTALGVLVPVPFLLRDASIARLGSYVLEKLHAAASDELEEIEEGAV